MRDLRPDGDIPHRPTNPTDYSTAPVRTPVTLDRRAPLRLGGRPYAFPCIPLMPSIAAPRLSWPLRPVLVMVRVGATMIDLEPSGLVTST